MSKEQCQGSLESLPDCFLLFFYFFMTSLMLGDHGDEATGSDLITLGNCLGRVYTKFYHVTERLSAQVVYLFILFFSFSLFDGMKINDLMDFEFVHQNKGVPKIKTMS